MMSTQERTDLAMWTASVDDALQKLVVDAQVGLNNDEVVERRRTYGRNQLQAAKEKRIVSIRSVKITNRSVVSRPSQRMWLRMTSRHF